MKIEPISYYHVTLDEPAGMEIDVTVVGDNASAFIVSPTHNEDGEDWNKLHEGLNFCNKAIKVVMAEHIVETYLGSGDKIASIPLDPDTPEPENCRVWSAEEVAASENKFEPILGNETEETTIKKMPPRVKPKEEVQQ